MQKAYLLLENGAVFPGFRFGAEGDVTGELVFSTSMTGYLETITDPSFFGQIVLQTFPLIGNYGVIPADFESKTPKLTAYVVKEWCQDPSNFRSEGNLDTFLKEKGVVGLFGVDTRAITKIIREQGVMNARIQSEPALTEEQKEELKHYKVQGAVAAVTCSEVAMTGPADGKRVALWDFGAKENIARELAKRNFRVIRVPASATAEEILSYAPEGLVLSNGPGDPAENTGIIQELKKLTEHRLPTFGICLGHQLLALALGAKTGRLKYGHRGANQPVRDLSTGRLYMTSQNHGYAVLSETLPDGAKESFVNANDFTCEGVDWTAHNAFSVQFHPEACAGPQDTGFLFDRFARMLED